MGLIEAVALLYLPSISRLITFLSNSMTGIASFVLLILIISLFAVSSILTLASLDSVEMVGLIT